MKIKMMAAAAAAILLASCTAVPPTPADAYPGEPTTVNVVAHEDDDLLFINPDVNMDVTGGKRTITVFLTAGDAGRGTQYYQDREAGARAAYAQMGGYNNTWNTTTPVVNGHAITKSCLSQTVRICLFFLRLPDGWHTDANLQKLQNGQVSTLSALDGSNTYTSADLTALINKIFTIYEPSHIRTSDWVANPGDHRDHNAAAAYAYAAHQTYLMPHTIYAYEGYTIVNKVVNLAIGPRNGKLTTFMNYAPHDYHVCQTYDACRADTYGRYMERKYIVRTATF